MRNCLKTLVSFAALGTAIQLNAQTVTVDSTTLVNGFMNWTRIATDASGFGGNGNSSWSLPALPAVFSGNTVTLSPNVNVYNASDPFWVNADGSGANLMDANLYNETTGTFVNTTLTFNFDVLANTLASGYSSIAFIKDFAPDFSSFTEVSAALTVGDGSLSKLTSANAGDHIQYGFETFGPDANPATVAALGSVIIAPTPEPASLALIGLGALGLFGFRRARKP